MDRKKFFWLMLAITVTVAAFLSPFASSYPDGLERVAEDTGFIERESELFSAPVPDYLFPGVENEAVGTSLAGIAGALLTLGAVMGIGFLLSQPGRSQEQ